MAAQKGGADKVKRQHDAGRLTVRERNDRLVDDSSFSAMRAVEFPSAAFGRNQSVLSSPSSTNGQRCAAASQVGGDEGRGQRHEP